MIELLNWIYPLPLEPPSHPTPKFHPSRSSQSTKLCSLCYTTTPGWLSLLHMVVYMSLTLPPLLCPQVYSLHLCLYCCPTNRFMSIISLGLIYIYMYVCINVWYLFFSLLQSVWQALGSSRSPELTQFHSFLWLSIMPLYVCTPSSLSIHLLRGIEAASMSWDYCK